jgi:regulator of sirC expression with transglutaminase-like and TPR domain
MMRPVPFDEFARQSPEDTGERDDLDLEVGAFLIARDAHPELDVDRQVARLDALASGLDRDALSAMTPEDAAHAIAEHVYRTHGFRGNEDAYGDPRNSYLDDVLERKLGIPISLAVVLLAVARRVGVAANGVSFPGHFLVRFERPGRGPLIVDPFYGGRPLTHHDLERLLRRTSGSTAKLQLDQLRAAPTRAILVRILQNLKAAHLARGDMARALVAAARIVTLLPRDPWALRDRGILQAQLGAPQAARADLLRYLELSPDATDAKMIEQVLTKLDQRPSAAN